MERLASTPPEPVILSLSKGRTGRGSHPELVEGSKERKLSFAMYILECSDGSYYTGSTVNLEYRVAAHDLGLGGRWTSPRLPVRVVFTQDFPSLREAFEAERQIKGWRCAKKRALIEGRFDLLPELARNDQNDRPGS